MFHGKQTNGVCWGVKQNVTLNRDLISVCKRPEHEHFADEIGRYVVVSALLWARRRCSQFVRRTRNEVLS